MSTTAIPQAVTIGEVEDTTCEVCQESADLEPWPCCGERTACADCCEYNQTCEACHRWEDRGMSLTTW